MIELGTGVGESLEEVNISLINSTIFSLMFWVVSVVSDGGMVVGMGEGTGVEVGMFVGGGVGVGVGMMQFWVSN